MKKSLSTILLICIFGFLRFLYADSSEFSAEKRLPLNELQNLTLRGDIDLHFTQSEEISLIVKAKKESDFEQLLYEYSGNTLILRNGRKRFPRLRGDVYLFNFRVNSYGHRVKFLLYVNAPSLEMLDKDFGGRIFFEPGVVLPKLDIKHSSGGRTDLLEITIGELNLSRSGGGALNLSGAVENARISQGGGGLINAEDFHIQELDLNHSGGGSINLSGTAESAKISRSGGGSINAENFTIKKANISTSGGGRTTVHISEELYLNSSGGGSINLSGTAENARISQSGGGAINAENFIIKKANIATSSGGRVTAHISEELYLNSSGGATIYLSGTAVNAKIQQRSGGRLNADKLVIENADIALSGGVRGSIYVTEWLSIQMSGGGRIYYSGNPRIRQNLSGDARLIYSED